MTKRSEAAAAVDVDVAVAAAVALDVAVAAAVAFDRPFVEFKPSSSFSLMSFMNVLPSHDFAFATTTQVLILDLALNYLLCPYMAWQGFLDTIAHHFIVSNEPPPAYTRV